MPNTTTPQFKLGDIVWTCAASSESSHYGDDAPRAPWRGKIIETLGTDLHRVSRARPDGTVDDDSNATAYVYSAGLAADLPAARELYKRALTAHIEDLHGQLAHYQSILDVL